MANSASGYLSELDLKETGDTPSLEEVAGTLDTVIRYINASNKLLAISRGFDGYIAENVVFQVAGSSDGRDSQRIEHFLGFVPKYRIILKQTGNGVLEDIPSGWNDKFITLKNRGAEVVTATIWLVRE